MHKFPSFLESPEAHIVFQKLFVHLYSLPRPDICLEKVMHWRSRFGLSSLIMDQTVTRVISGTFYNFSTSVPSQEMLAKEIAEAETAGIHQFLIPTVRSGYDTKMLSNEGFSPIPWFVESIYERRQGVDSDLKMQLSRSQFKDILRLERKATANFYLEFYDHQQIMRDYSIVQIASELHQLNINKYSHAHNFYSEAILNMILSSAIAKNLLICVRRDKLTRRPVQASINFIDRERSQLFQMVQGINHSLVKKGHNLYIAETLQMYRYAESQGINEIHLGRGAHESKKKIGANCFHLLNNWVLNTTQSIHSEIAKLTEASRQHLMLDEAFDYSI